MGGSKAVTGLALGAAPGLILYALGSYLGPSLDPGWGDIIQGLVGFIAIFGAALGFRLATRAAAKKAGS
jgi:hypothetical protein